MLKMRISQNQSGASDRCYLDGFLWPLAGGWSITWVLSGADVPLSQTKPYKSCPLISMLVLSSLPKNCHLASHWCRILIQMIARMLTHSGIYDLPYYHWCDPSYHRKSDEAIPKVRRSEDTVHTAKEDLRNPNSNNHKHIDTQRYLCYSFYC